MEVEEYLRGSTLFRRLKNGRHGQHFECFAVHLVEVGLVRQGTWRCLNVVGGFLSWMDRRRCALAGVDERMIERYLRHRAGRQSIQPGDRAALKRWLAVLRNEGIIAAAVPPPLTPHDRIFKAFEEYLRTERGLAHKSIIRHLPIIRRFLREVCPVGADDLSKINQEDVIRYVERHAQDWSPKTGKVLVTARISPLPPSSRAEPALFGRLRAVDATMEAGKSADLSVRRSSAEGSGQL